MLRVGGLEHAASSGNPLGSPACSLDRLRIEYGKKRIMISPPDKPGFLRALAQRAPQLELLGERARRRR